MFIGGLILGLLFTSPLILFVYNIIIENMWKNGVVPNTFAYSKDNLFEIYIALAVVMIRAEKRDMYQKKKHLVKYAKEHFPNSLDTFRSSYRTAFSYKSIKLKSACNWIKRSISDESYRSQVLYFLSGIAFEDGRLNRKEEKILYTICTYLDLDPKTLDSIINGYKEAFERKYREEERQKKQKQESRRERSKNYRKKRMAAILEVNENASFNEINV